MISWFRSNLGSPSGTARKQSRQVKLGIEMLEDRTLMSAGALDPTFGTGGIVLTDFGHTGDAAFATALQRDGKIIVVGSSDQPGTGSNFAVARYNADGSLDRSFGIAGKVTTDFGNTDDGAMAVAVEQDGKIIVAGWSNQPGTGADFAVARYYANGKLDKTFGEGGKVVTDLGSPYEWGESLVVQRDGKIVVGGIAFHQGFLHDFTLLRYNRNGTLDSTFGNQGVVRTDFAGRWDYLYTLLLQPDGKIIAAGQANETLGEGMGVARYNSNGSLDTTFGTGGKVWVYFWDFGADGFKAALQPDGKIILSGWSYQNDNDYDFALARLNPNGSLDTSFGTGGQLTTDFHQGFDICACVAVQPDGKIVAGGYTQQPDSQINFAMVRYNPNGTLDMSFGSNGEVVTDLGGDAFVRGLIIEPHHGIVAVGYSSQPGTGNDFTLVRYAAN